MSHHCMLFFNTQKQQRCLDQTYLTHLGIQNQTKEQRQVTTGYLSLYF